MRAMTSLRSDYEAINSYQKIADFIGQFEGTYLDFKQMNPQTPLNDEDKAGLSKAISGFANGGGGLIIWGIQCDRNNPEKIDRAHRLVPIQNVAKVFDKLRDLASSAQIVVPAIEGIDHKIILQLPKDADGYIVTIVPQSDLGPHCATKQVFPYWKRNGPSMRKMEHFDLEDMFGRRRRPHLALATRNGSGISVGNGYSFRYVYLSVINQGKGSAQFATLKVKVNDPHLATCKRIPGRYDHNQLIGNWSEGERNQLNIYPLRESDLHNEHEAVFALGANDVIHPGGSVTIGVIFMRNLGNMPDMQLEYELLALDMAPVTGKLTRKPE